jgi:predicted phosphodiesterase
MKKENEVLFRKALDNYLTTLTTPVEQYATKKKNLRLPILPISVFKALCNDAEEIFKSEPLMLHIEAPIVIVGDLHGHFLDLIRILKLKQCPPYTKYLFLGDYVDKGEFSTETISLILLLKVFYPNHVYAIRGNHEFQEIFKNGGFACELIKLYESPDPVEYISKTFSQMPIACDIDGFIFCCHGGIGPAINVVEQLSSIPRPIDNFNNSIVNDLLWSDPSTVCETYDKSSRGGGHLFGQTALNMFLSQNMYSLLIRGHQVVDGCKFELSHKVVTVFSASSYYGTDSNCAGIIHVKRGHKYEKETFPPIPYFKRNDVSFYFMTTRHPRPPLISTKATNRMQSAKDIGNFSAGLSKGFTRFGSLPASFGRNSFFSPLPQKSYEQPVQRQINKKIITPKSRKK